ncbi:MAG: sulfite exporter TauE/SafE family protein [Hyphomicrobiales bacterium]
MTLLQIAVTLAGGGLVGFVLGLVGGGGSILAVPMLLYGVGLASPHMAIGTSAVAVAINALGNLWAAARQQLVKWPCAMTFSAAGLSGSLAGSHLALLVPGQKLMALFGALMVVIAIAMLLRRGREGNPDVRLTRATARLMLPRLLALGFSTGSLAGFFGIGGGFLIVPGLMLATGMTISNAIATSLVGITAFGAATAATYAWAGEVDWPLAALFVLGSFGGSFLGQMAARPLRNHRAHLQSLFAGFVLVIGCYTIYKGLAAV